MSRTIENAHKLVIGVCIDPKCQCVHIQFEDRNGQVFAQAALPIREIPSTIDDLSSNAYHIVASGKEKL